MNFLIEILLLFTLLKYLQWEGSLLWLIVFYIITKIVVWAFLTFISAILRSSADKIALAVKRKKKWKDRTLDDLKEEFG